MSRTCPVFPLVLKYVWANKERTLHRSNLLYRWKLCAKYISWISFRCYSRNSEHQQMQTKCYESHFRYIWAKCTMLFVVDKVARWLGFFIVSGEGVPTTHCYVYMDWPNNMHLSQTHKWCMTWASQTCPRKLFGLYPESVPSTCTQPFTS